MKTLLTPTRLLSLVAVAALAAPPLVGQDPPELRLPEPKPRVVFDSYVRAVAAGETWEAVITQTPAAWKLAQGEGVVVAVLDTGVDNDHPEVKGKVIYEEDFTGSRSGAKDVQGHGTHCASIVAGSVNVDGPAPKCKLLDLKVLGDDGSGNFAWLERGIGRAIEKGAHVLSISIGSGPSRESPDTFSPSMRKAIRRAVDAGLIVVVAMGNSGPSYPSGEYPGRYPEVVAVAACDANRQIGEFSSRDDAVYVAAPGVDVLGALPGGRYAKWDGTSMATPRVAGIAALYVERCKAVGAKPSQDGFKRLLRETSATKSTVRPNPNSGYGLIQAADLLNKVTGPVTPPPPADPLTLTIDFGRSVGAATVDGSKVKVTFGANTPTAGPTPTPAATPTRPLSWEYLPHLRSYGWVDRTPDPLVPATSCPGGVCPVPAVIPRLMPRR